MSGTGPVFIRRVVREHRAKPGARILAEVRRRRMAEARAELARRLAPLMAELWDDGETLKLLVDAEYGDTLTGAIEQVLRFCDVYRLRILRGGR